MTRTIVRNWLVTVGLILAGSFLLASATGCDDYAVAGDINSPTVEPADFSPYGYDYSVYDILTDV